MKSKKDFNTAKNLTRHKLSEHGKAVRLILLILFVIDFGKFKNAVTVKVTG